MIFAVICLLVCLEREKREERKRHQEQREGSELKKKSILHKWFASELFLKIKNKQVILKMHCDQFE